MLTITIAQWVGNIFSISMYDMVIFLRRIPYLPALLPPNVDRLVAEDVMIKAKDLHALPRIVRVMDVVRVLQASSHNGFPVYEEFQYRDKTGAGTKQRVIGMVIRSQLISLMQKKFWAEDLGDDSLYREFCVCGNQFMDDSLFCRKCARPRPTQPPGNSIKAQPGGTTNLRLDEDALAAMDELATKSDSPGVPPQDQSKEASALAATDEEETDDPLLTPKMGATGKRVFDFQRCGSELELDEMDKLNEGSAYTGKSYDRPESKSSTEQSTLRRRPSHAKMPGAMENGFDPVSPRSPLSIKGTELYLTSRKSLSKDELDEMTAVEELHSDIVELTVEDMQNKYLDLTMFMDSSPVTVYPSTPFRRMYRIFLQMGMRHMTVVSPDSSLLGLITRKDLWVHAGVRLTDSCTRFNMRSGF